MDSKIQLASKLAEIIISGGVSDLDNDLDNIIKEAKKRAKEIKRKKDLGELFNEQLRTLVDRGVPEEIINRKFWNQKKSVVQRASEIPAKGIPFIPVIPLSYRGVFDLMAMVECYGGRGYTNCDNPDLIIDEIKTPRHPYYIYDIDDSKVTNNPLKEKSIDKMNGRSPLTLAETVALAVHSTVLLKRMIWINGSYYNYKETKRLMMLFVVQGIGPCLGSSKVLEDFTTKYEMVWPSCGSRG